MLKKKERLTRALFDHYFSIGKRIHSPFLQVVYAPCSTKHGSVVVGKKVAKKAVDRNTLRRRIYGVLYTFLQAQKVPLCVIIIAKAGAQAIPRQKLALEVKEALAQIPKTPL